MAKKTVEIVFILDRSGSMSGLEKDTIGGYNSFIKEQRELKEGDAYITLVLFDNQYDVIYENVNVNDVKELTSELYYPRGSTALVDAFAKTINSFKPKNKKSSVIFIVTTDGEENSSIEYTSEQLKKLVEDKKLKKNGSWEFLFLGTNIDSFSVAGNYGINMANTVNYSNTNIGTRSVYTSTSMAVTGVRSSTGDVGVSSDWKKGIK